jgi:hypothetical protein
MPSGGGSAAAGDDGASPSKWQPIKRRTHTPATKKQKKWIHWSQAEVSLMLDCIAVVKPTGIHFFNCIYLFQAYI